MKRPIYDTKPIEPLVSRNYPLITRDVRRIQTRVVLPSKLPSALEDPYGSMEDVRRATLYELLIPHAENYTDNVGRILHKLTAIPQPCNID
jgi:hypothetical protein